MDVGHALRSTKPVNELVDYLIGIERREKARMNRNYEFRGRASPEGRASPTYSPRTRGGGGALNSPMMRANYGRSFPNERGRSFVPRGGGYGNGGFYRGGGRHGGGPAGGYRGGGGYGNRFGFNGGRGTVGQQSRNPFGRGGNGGRFQQHQRAPQQQQQPQGPRPGNSYYAQEESDAQGGLLNQGDEQAQGQGELFYGEDNEFTEEELINQWNESLYWMNDEEDAYYGDDYNDNEVFEYGNMEDTDLPEGAPREPYG